MQLLTKTRLQALVRLLDEEAENFAIIREHLLKAGEAALPFLEEAMHSPEKIVRDRARQIAAHLRFDHLRDEFVRYAGCADWEMDLEKGAHLVARYAYPDLRWGKFAAELDRMAESISESLEDEMYMEDVIDCINEHFFEKEGFRADNRRFYDPENSYINRVIERRLGIPISLSVVYLLVARRLNLPISGVAFPGHFLVRYDGPYETLWIDPFNEGSILDREDCEELLRSMGYPVLEEYLKPCTTRQIIARMLTNLAQVFERQGENDEATKVKDLVEVLIG